MKNVAQIYLLTGLGMSLLAVGCDQAVPAEPEPTSLPEAPAMQHGPPHVASGPPIVTSLNTLTGDVTLAAGSNVTLTPSDNTLTIAAVSAAGNTLDQAYDQGGAGTGRTIVADAGAVNITSSGGLTVAGRVGIGTTSPLFDLEIFRDANSGNSSIRIVNPNTGAFAGTGLILGYKGTEYAAISSRSENHPTQPDHLVIIQNHGTGSKISFITNGGQRMVIDDVGRVGIGTASPTERLHVNGNALATAHTVPSSRRWKENITPIEGALDKVLRLRGVSFAWKADGRHDIGLIAEEVGEVIPGVVVYEENGEDAKSVDYARLVAVLIEAIKEQQAEIGELTAAVRSLSGTR